MGKQSRKPTKKTTTSYTARPIGGQFGRLEAMMAEERAGRAERERKAREELARLHAEANRKR